MFWFKAARGKSQAAKETFMTKANQASKSAIRSRSNGPARTGETAGVYLRALSESDLERVHGWHNDPELYVNFPTPFRHVSMVAEREWLQKRTAPSSNSVNMAICLSPGGEHIGNIYLTDINWIARNAAIGMFLADPGSRRRGYGTDAMRQLLAHAFRDLGLIRIYGNILANNFSSIKMVERIGFELEGRMKMQVFKDGQYQDVLIVAIGAERFRELEAKG